MSSKITKKIDKKIDKLSNLWKITINEDAIEEEIKKQLNRIQAQVHLDGFRAGKAPLDVVEKKYGEDAFFRAVNSLVRNSISEIVEEEKYKLAMQPEVSFSGEIKRHEDIVVHVTFVQKPEIPDIKYDKIEVDSYELELSEKDKEEELENFRGKMGTPKLVEGEKAVEKGDIVDIDFTGRTASDNVEFSGGSAKGFKLEIGSKSFIDGFEDQIIGHKKGESFEIKVKFPDPYPTAELAGKDAIFAIVLNDVYTKELPELNDDYAKKLGFENIDKLKELLFGNLKNVYESNLKNMLKGNIFDKIIEKNKFDLPESVIEKELNDLLDREKEAHKDDKKWNEKDAKKSIEERLHRSYSSFYLTDGIADKNDIKITDDEIKQVAVQDAIRNGMDTKEVLERLEKDDKLKNYIYFTIKEAKVFEFIFDNVKKNVKKLDKKAFEKVLEEQRNSIIEQNNK